MPHTPNDRCPHCRARKDKPWHLVCAACWARVPAELRDEVYDEYRRRAGSRQHRSACYRVIRYLLDHKADTRDQPPQPIAEDDIPW